MTVSALFGVWLADAPDARAAVTDESDCRTIPAPAADLLLARDAWAAFGVDGSGVRVGIISNSFDSGVTPNAADDVATGLLPGPGNPCGRETPVSVVAESAQEQDDEGRAMAQLVHGIAPGAELLFAATEETNAGLAASIDLLVQAGADIIVDDVALEDDLAFARGAAGAAVEAAVDQGVLYLAAAGNYGMIGAAGYASAGYPISGWSAMAYQPTECSPAVAAKAGVPVDCMDFDAGAAADPGLDVTLAPASGIPLSLDWAEPVGGVTTRIGLALEEPATGDVGVGWAANPAVPHFWAGIAASQQTEPGELVLSIVRERSAAEGTPAVSLLLESNDSASTLWDMEYFRSGGDVVVGNTLNGHQADPATMPIAAVNAQTLTLERFSSAGPATTLIGVDAPVTVAGPAVAGLDGLPISFPLGSGGTTFLGTSAAAPTVAAVAALMAQAAPDADPSVLRAALVATARPDAFTSPWAAEIDQARFRGAGLVDASAAVAAVVDDPAPSPSGPPEPAAAPGSGRALADSGSDGVTGIAAAAIVSILAGVIVSLRRRRPASG